MSLGVEAFFDEKGEYLAGKSTAIITGDNSDLSFICGILNSSVISFYIKYQYHSLKMAGGYININADIIKSIPFPKVSTQQGNLTKQLVGLISFSKIFNLENLARFLSDLIDACVMEVYFPKHMAELGLLFHHNTAKLLTDYDPEAPVEDYREFLTTFYQTANAPDHPIRNHLMRLAADSPDLLAVIKNDGKA